MINERFARHARSVFLPMLRIQPRISSFPPEVKTFDEYTNNVLEAYSVTPPIFNQNRETLGSNLSNNDNLNECYRVKKRRQKILKRKVIEGFSNKKKNKKTIYDKLKNYVYNDKNNLIFTTYFCNNKDIHHDRFAPCEDIRYIGNWYYSMKKLNLMA